MGSVSVKLFITCSIWRQSQEHLYQRQFLLPSRWNFIHKRTPRCNSHKKKTKPIRSTMFYSAFSICYISIIFISCNLFRLKKYLFLVLFKTVFIQELLLNKIPKMSHLLLYRRAAHREQLFYTKHLIAFCLCHLLNFR